MPGNLSLATYMCLSWRGCLEHSNGFVRKAGIVVLASGVGAHLYIMRRSRRDADLRTRRRHARGRPDAGRSASTTSQSSSQSATIADSQCARVAGRQLLFIAQNANPILIGDLACAICFVECLVMTGHA